MDTDHKDIVQYYNNYDKIGNFRKMHWYYSVSGMVVTFLSSLILFFLYKNHPTYLFASNVGFILFSCVFVLCFIWKKFKKATHNIYFLYVVFITVLAWNDLNSSTFETSDLLLFIIVFFLSNTFFQRIHFLILYILTMLTLLFISLVDHPEQSKIILFIILTVFICGASSLVMMEWRNKSIKKVKNYSAYLSTIINHPEVGYALLNFENNEILLLDYNETIYTILGVQQKELKETISKTISHRAINLLKQNQKQVYDVVIHTKVFEFNIDTLEIGNAQNYLLRIYDISKERAQEKQLAEREQKYRNLIDRNLAGVFILSENGNIIEYNTTFASFFKNTGLENEQIKNLFYFSKKAWEEIKKELNHFQKSTNFNLQFLLPKTNLFLLVSLHFDEENNVYEATAIDVSEIENANQILHENEERYRLIFKESNDAILISTKGKINTINKNGLLLLGEEEKNIIGKDIWEYSSKNYNKKALQEKYIKNNNGNKFYCEWEIVRSNGEIIQIDLSTSYFIQNGIEFEQTIIKDVTEQKQQEKELKNSQRTFKNIIENIPEGILLFNEDEKVVFANPEAYNLFKTTEKTPENIDLNKLFKEKDKKNLNQALKEHYQSNKIISGQLKQDNNTRIEYSILSILFENQKTTMLILKDITLISQLETEQARAKLAEETSKQLIHEIEERKNTEKKLEEQSIRLKSIIENSSNTIIWTIDKDYNLKSFNSFFEKTMLQFSTKEIKIGQNFIDILKEGMTEKGLPEVKEVFKKAFKGKSLQIEGVLVYGGRNNWYETFLNPIPDIDGQINEVSCVGHNITDKKLNNKELLNSLHEKEILLKEVHHRVKNNLQVISSILNLQSSYVSDDKTLQILQESQNRIKSMSFIHENLYRTKDFSSINFSEYIKNLSYSLLGSYQIYDNVISLDFDFEEHVQLDLDRAIPCGLIVNELVSNALKYAFTEKEKSGKISLSLKKENGQLRIEIGDNGVGIPKELDIENTETLGLQLVLALIDQIDATMELKREKGTKYLITFEE